MYGFWQPLCANHDGTLLKQYFSGPLFICSVTYKLWAATNPVLLFFFNDTSVVICSFAHELWAATCFSLIMWHSLILLIIRLLLTVHLHLASSTRLLCSNHADILYYFNGLLFILRSHIVSRKHLLCSDHGGSLIDTLVVHGSTCFVQIILAFFNTLMVHCSLCNHT